MNFYLENPVLKIAINSKGAELLSLYNKETQLEYMWNGDANFWSKTSPVLFPIVGGLKNNEYSFEDKKYTLTRHGFARDNEYEVNQIHETKIVFTLKNNETTFANYPFQFIFSVEYSIENNTLYCKYVVENTGSNTMYFSVGAHPAFKIPLTNNTSFNDWFLEFNKSENCSIYPINAAGLIETSGVPFLDNTNQLALTKELFYKDALIFKELQSTVISIKSSRCDNGLTMQIEGFPFYGIWNAKDADFVCLEPWCGLGDTADTTGNIAKKEGINTLESHQTFERVWSIAMF
jgi:galactose mutarotase-like enzyme